MPLVAAQVPNGKRIYAVGDIHGRIDLLRRLQRAIIADASAKGDGDATIVYLGDYVDRGDRSFQVVDWLASVPLPGFSAVHLCGNHEAMMLTFLGGKNDPLWLMNGGIATLESYGVPFDWRNLDDAALESLRRRLIAAIPPTHRKFYSDLQLSYTCGDYLFVHAGVRPGRPLDLQDPRDMM